jgi:hypothetical protein
MEDILNVILDFGIIRLDVQSLFIMMLNALSNSDSMKFHLENECCALYVIYMRQ